MVTASTAGRSRRDLDSAIEYELTEFFRERAAAATAYGSGFVRLWTLAGQNVLGGKLVRPLLLIDTFDALREDHLVSSEVHGDAPARATVIKIAAAIELLHYAFLLHDDVIDGDLTRRGRANLIGSLVAEASPAGFLTNADAAPGGSSRIDAGVHAARAGGLLMGDLLLAATHQLFARAALPHETRTRILDILDHTITESVAGEQLDVELSDGWIDPDLETIIAMSGYKTSTYTFELPLRTAAALAGASATVEMALASAARHLGLAFQLQDDLLSTFGDPRRHGKDPFSDLREGKQTAIIAYARKTSAWPVIEPLLGCRDLTTRDAARVRDLLATCGAQSFVESLIDAQLKACDALLASPMGEIPQSAGRVLASVAAQLEGRAA